MNQARISSRPAPSPALAVHSRSHFDVGMLYSSEEDVELTEADVKVGRVSQRSVGDLHPHGEAHGVGAHAVDSDVGQTDPCALQQCLERDIFPRQTLQTGVQD